MIPEKLKKGDHIRIIAPSESFQPKLTKELKERGIKRLESLRLNVSFGKYVDERDDFDTATIEHRLEDLHDAFTDSSVQAVLAVIGGSSANQLLKRIDYELIKENPKIFCGLSDLTELSSALYVKSNLVTYYGPHFTMLAGSKLIDHSLQNMKEVFFSKAPVKLSPPDHFLNSLWDDEVIVKNNFWTINEGEAEAKCVGGNLMTMNFLLGNRFFPTFSNCILYVEENHIVDHKGVQKELQEILNHPGGENIQGLIIGRFQKETGMSRKLLTEMIKTKKELKGIPVIANVDISHTAPIVSVPFGGKMKISAGPDDKINLIITEH